MSFKKLKGKEMLAKKEECEEMSLSDKKQGNIDCEFYMKENVKECFKRIEMKLLSKYKFASMPIIEIIKEELGKELTEEKGA